MWPGRRYNTYSTRVTRGGIAVQKKLTITIDESVYEGLYRVIGPRKISQFIERLVRPHVLYPDLEAEYEEMARDKEGEAAALEWAEATVGDVADETW
jgi:hypothetical protein